MATTGNGHGDLATAVGPEGQRDKPIGELLRDLADETTTLVKQELDLAKAEMQQKGKEAGKGAGMLGGAGVAGLLFLGSLTATVMGVLDTAMAFWLAALIVTLIWGAVAAVLALTGKKELEEAGKPVPEQAIESTKEDVAWAKTRARSASR
jgi:hypothetical protein